MDTPRKIIRTQQIIKTNIQKNTLLIRNLQAANKNSVVRPVQRVVQTQKAAFVTQKPIANAQSSVRKPSVQVVNRHQIVQTPRKQSALKEQILKDVSYDKIISLKNTGVEKTLIMIGCGPSVNEVDFTSLLNNPRIDFMVINKPYRKVWPAKYWAFCDPSQYERNKEEFNDYNGTIINSIAVRARTNKGNQVIINVSGSVGVSYDMTRGYVIGRSSVYANMQVALWMGYPKVFIFGCDMNPNGLNGQLHHYGVNPDVEPDKRATRFKYEADHYSKMATMMPEHLRKRFYFCSSCNEYPFVYEFNKLDHKKAVEFITNSL